MDPVTIGQASKGLSKLLDVVGNAVGKWYEPLHVKRLADAKSHERLVLARADAQAEVETKAILNLDPDSAAVADDVPILRRAAERLKHQELKRQENIEAVVRIAAETVAQNVSDQPVDDEWATRFFSAASELSDDGWRRRRAA